MHFLTKFSQYQNVREKAKNKNQIKNQTKQKVSA